MRSDFVAYSQHQMEHEALIVLDKRAVVSDNWAMASIAMDMTAVASMDSIDLDRKDTMDSYLEVVACPSPTTEKQSI